MSDEAAVVSSATHQHPLKFVTKFLLTSLDGGFRSLIFFFSIFLFDSMIRRKN